jgi:hypothetical protein
MKSLLGFAAAGLAVLAGGSVAQAQYFHGHVHYHRGHYHLHGHWHYPSYYSVSPVIYGSPWYTPAYSYPPVVSSTPTVIYQPPVVNPTGVVSASAASLKPNALPPYTGPGVTLRLPAELTVPFYLQVDRRDVELKPGTEVTLKDKASYVVEFDRGGDFGAARQELTEGRYKLGVGAKGWYLVPDPVNNDLRQNKLPGEPKQ